jgi:hypothetical protein
MDYIISPEMEGPLGSILAAVVPLGFIFAIVRSRFRLSNRGLLIGGIATFVSLATYGIISNIDASVSRAAAQEKTLESFKEYYGVTLDEKDLAALGYPGLSTFLNPPEELTYYNTAPIQTGESREDFEQLTLAGEDGKIYLYRQVGATYEELEPVESE